MKIKIRLAKTITPSSDEKDDHQSGICIHGIDFRDDGDNDQIAMKNDGKPFHF